MRLGACTPNLHDGFLHLNQKKLSVHDEEVGEVEAWYGQKRRSIPAVQCSPLEPARTIVPTKSGEQTNVAVEKGQVRVLFCQCHQHGEFARV